jgi:hypothetical protein
VLCCSRGSCPRGSCPRGTILVAGLKREGVRRGGEASVEARCEKDPRALEEGVEGIRL